MKSWYERARDGISAMTRDWPRDMPFAERRRALQAAYPWGERANHPYKAWCKAQREYLARFDDRPMKDGLFGEADKAHE